MKVNNKNLTLDNWTELLSPKANSTDALIDVIGDVKAELSLLKKIEGYLKEVIPTNFDEEFEHQTERYYISRTGSTRVSLNTTQVKEEMGDDWWADHCQETDYFTLRVKALEA